MTATKLKRLEDLEKLDGGGECPHSWRVVHVHPGQPEPGPEVCEICHLIRRQITVRHVEGVKSGGQIQAIDGA